MRRRSSRVSSGHAAQVASAIRFMLEGTFERGLWCCSYWLYTRATTCCYDGSNFYMPVATLNMVRVNRRQKLALQSQLYRQIRELIITGQLKAGVRLPSTRDLVSQLGVSRNTIVYALDQHVAEGYLQSRLGSGIYVEHLPGRDDSVALRGNHEEHLS